MTQSYPMYRFCLSYTELEVVVIRETDTVYECISPFVYAWMQHLSMERWEDAIETIQIKKTGTKRTEIKRNSPYDAWIFDYPIDASMLSHISDVSSFFELFSYYHYEEIVPRVEKTISMMKPHMMIHYLKSCVTFVFKQHRTHPDRLRFLFSPMITPYIERGDEHENTI